MSNLSNIIDQLGTIKAQISLLQEQEKALKEALSDLPAGKHDGDVFRLTISDANRETLDMAAVREHLSRQFIQAHTNVTTVRSFRTAVRNVAKLAV